MRCVWNFLDKNECRTVSALPRQVCCSKVLSQVCLVTLNSAFSWLSVTQSFLMRPKKYQSRNASQWNTVPQRPWLDGLVSPHVISCLFTKYFSGFYFIWEINSTKLMTGVLDSWDQSFDLSRFGSKFSSYLQNMSILDLTGSMSDIQLSKHGRK